MTPWLANLPRFFKQSGDDNNKKQKVSTIIERLITLTIEEFDMLVIGIFKDLFLLINDPF